jgi:flavin-dependent dehydrogenase
MPEWTDQAQSAGLLLSPATIDVAAVGKSTSAVNTMKRLVVIGSSISGAMAACYLKLRFPDVEIISIQKQRAKFPIVGESLTEFSTLMLYEIGLGPYLEERHFHKYGLTFYFKEKISDPTDYTYATHEATRIPPMPSNQINRLALADRLRERIKELKIETIDGTVRDVSIGEGGLNRLVYATDAGDSVILNTRWIVDASGRSRVLANKLGLKKISRFQRSSFWFRLKDFDKGILKQMDEVKGTHHCFDSYYVTHHFFGKHNWIWAIPMRSDSEAAGDLISIGIVYRPDLYKKHVTSLDTFLANVEAEHPVVAKLVRSGRIVDINVYRNYFYETQRSYSRHGWFIIGDAGDTVDPLYSTGIAMTSIQIKQAASIIDADIEGTLSEQFIDDVEKVYKTIRDSVQAEISTLYEVMDDPFQCHIRMHCASAFYFFVLLPFYLSGYVTDRVGARVMTRVVEHCMDGFASLKSLLVIASRCLGALPATEIKNRYDETVNWELFGPSEEMMPYYLAKCCVFFAKIRFHALRRARWHDWPKHVLLCLADLLKAVLFRAVVQRRAIKGLRVAKWV